MKPDANLPLNQRIRADIEARILSGEWPPGHRIPFEHELMVQYGCSRMTVNKVLSLLADAGMIERRRRLGSFVARPHPHIESVALKIPDIPMDVAARGYRYGYRRLSRRLRAAERGTHEVELASGGRLLSLECLHLADERPFALERRLVSTVAAPQVLDQEFADTAPGSWLLQNVPWTRAQHRISAIGADADLATMLEAAPGTPCLMIERRTWRGDVPVTWVRQFFLGESYDLLAHFSPGGR